MYSDLYTAVWCHAPRGGIAVDMYAELTGGPNQVLGHTISVSKYAEPKQRVRYVC